LAFREAFFKPPKKLRGGQPLNWLHTIKKDFKTINLSVEEAIRLSKNRQGYKNAIGCLMARSQTDLKRKQDKKIGDRAGKGHRRRRKSEGFMMQLQRHEYILIYMIVVISWFCEESKTTFFYKLHNSLLKLMTLALRNNSNSYIIHEMA